MADRRRPEAGVDPKERAPGSCYLGDPAVVNMNPVAGADQRDKLRATVGVVTDWLTRHGFAR
jgi:hypothetical protein